MNGARERLALGDPYHHLERVEWVSSDWTMEQRGDPAVFTVRHMNRNTRAMLEACRVHEQVLLRMEFTNALQRLEFGGKARLAASADAA